jgi:hypothetical protein
MAHIHVHIHTFDAFDPAKHPRGGKSENTGEFSEAGSGSKSGSKKATPEKKAPTPENHPLVKGRNLGAWGNSHSNSYNISGEAADRMGISGYRKLGDPDNEYSTNPESYYYKSEKKEASRLANIFLKAIKDSPGSPEKLYHGFQNIRNTKWQKGMTVRMSLTSTAGTPDTIGYGMRNNPEDNEGPPTLFEFPVGTKMAGYSKWNKADAKDFGHTWSEALVAGEFEVQDIRKGMSDDSRKTPYTIVSLKPSAYFDPETENWQKV